jgi:ankyrin repeat protein
MNPETVKDFFDAIKADDIFELTKMINQDAAIVDAVNENGVPALLFSIYYVRKEVAGLLLQSGAKVDAFIAAAMGDRKRLEKALGENPGAIGEYSADGWTPLHLASFYRHKELVEVLLERGATVSVASKNQMGNHPLHAAAAGGSRDIVALLLEKGASVNAVQQGGWTALHSAAQGADVEMVKMLLANGANPDVRADNGQSPIDLAMGKGAQDVVDILMQAPKIQ